ncbi:probable GDP-L-fucose synthase 1 isoform X1 [Musa acuminata AAA Group]|uniref:probable GDP-L-fucose synthase 1 isoform X1 n=1 Tax=Musa acuminata AAA Group TaxID=214697 RepID=UPI0031D69965
MNSDLTIGSSDNTSSPARCKPNRIRIFKLGPIHLVCIGMYGHVLLAWPSPFLVSPFITGSSSYDLLPAAPPRQGSGDLLRLPFSRISEMGAVESEATEVIGSFLSDTAVKVFIAGHRGLVGSAIHRKLLALGFTNLLLRTHSELDLTRQADVEAFFAAERPRYVIVAAAKVGGIHANSTYPADFVSVNLQIQTNIIDAALRCAGGAVRKLLFLGSSCIYPKLAPQPIPESALLSGPLEPTNEWYAVAKISGIKMCQAYRIQHGLDAISAMPTNLYGPHDNFHPENSHVLPALIRRFHKAKISGAKEVVVWGTGSPLREFLHVDDLADAVVFLMDRYSGLEHVNVGSGKEVTIKGLAEMVKEVVGFEGDLVWDSTKPDGTPRKLMDSSKLAGMGWEAKIPLRQGLADTYKCMMASLVFRWKLW